ncbi:peptidase M23 [Pontibacillus halophilus JSM 076056 = DSM 19796]|uniref:Peptidase M23 n=1 Tax=Pontibacillus halophilus JSM 076056 = DSM 19796 TaxID=1385510 RepID=A0A0A5GR23_9BACI|nr:M23 family metallopeptidase [Pontibacillus halophilus]KGX93698.1 peptidase M23 [Pontibacillus halophilus JSM 076056 = DSM 19796]
MGIVRSKKRYSPSHHSFWKKVVLTTTIGIGVTVGSAYADTIEQQLPTVYHVYMDGEHIGTVDDQSMVQQYVQKQIESKQGDYEDLSLTSGETITYVPEKVFRPSFDNEQIMKTLENELTIKVDAVGLQIDEEVITYVENEDKAKAVVRSIKESYVDEDWLDKLKEREDEETPIQVDEDVELIDVSLSKDVSYTSQKVAPDEVVTKDEAISILEQGSETDETYEIQEGDVLGKVASKFDLSMDELMSLNDGMNEDSVIQIGQTVNVKDTEPYVHVVSKKRVEEMQTIEHETETKKSSDLYKGEEKVLQEGQDGEKRITYEIVNEDGQETSKDVITEKVTKDAEKRIVVKGTKEKPSRGTGDFVNPTRGGVLTSEQGERWGSYHKGIDVAGVTDRSILAVDNGTVTSTGFDSSGYGNKVVINHNNGYKTIYAHLSSISVDVGDTVTAGSTIGQMGTTGRSTGVHLHFEVYKDGDLQNPLQYVNY